MNRNSDPLYNLADALSEDIVAARADTLVRDAASDPGGQAALTMSFDRIAARAAAQSRRRRIVERLRTLLATIVPPMSWTSAMAAVASLAVVVVAGGVYFEQRAYNVAANVAPPVVRADRLSEKYIPNGGNQPMSYAQDRAATADHAAAAPPAPAAAPPAVAPAPPPAPAAVAGVANAPTDEPKDAPKDEPKRVRTVATGDSAADRGPASVRAARATPGRPQPRGEDRLGALAMAAEQKGASVQSPATQMTAATPAAAPAPPVARSALAANTPDSPPSFLWPLRGAVVSGFGSLVGGVPNSGIDLAVPAGTDIRAAEDGVVLYVGNEIKGLGNLILLRHRDGYVTAYAHAKSFAVKSGDAVRRGQVIAKSGRTGTVSAPQLHFEIRKGNAPVDPAQYLPPPG